MPEQYELPQNQTKAGNGGQTDLPIDYFAGWPGLTRTPLRQALPGTGTGSRPTGPLSVPTESNPSTGRLAPTTGRIDFDPSRVDIFSGWPGLDSGGRYATPTDQTVKYPVRNGVVEINFNDLTRLNGLPATDGDYSTLKINNVPPGTQILHWADGSGYYFFFQGAGEQNIYHYPRSLRIIDLGGQRFDLDRSRLKVNEYALAQAAGAQDLQKNPFATVSNPRVDAINYFKNMSRLSAQSLAWQEDILRKGAQDSKNPYFQIYLADVLTIEAVQPLVRGFLQQGTVTPEQKQQILDKLTEAERQLKQAAEMSYGPLYQMNRFPQGNVVMPLAPDAQFHLPPPGVYYDPYYAYWGGAWDQAQRRATALAFVKGLIQSNVFNYFELPPYMPPR